MKTKRTTRAAYAAFLAAFASECAEVGIQPVPDSGDEYTHAKYQIITRAGLYTFQPAFAFGEGRGTVYDVTVFGRFEHPGAAKDRVNCNPYSGKWNFHAGEGLSEQEAREYATHVVTRILNV